MKKAVFCLAVLIVSLAFTVEAQVPSGFNGLRFGMTFAQAKTVFTDFVELKGAEYNGSLFERVFRRTSEIKRIVGNLEVLEVKEIRYHFTGGNDVRSVFCEVEIVTSGEYLEAVLDIFRDLPGGLQAVEGEMCWKWEQAKVMIWISRDKKSREISISIEQKPLARLLMLE